MKSVGLHPCILAEHRCREHDLIGAGGFGKGRQTVPQLMRATDEDPRAIRPARLFLMRRVAVGLRLFRARQRAIVTAHPAHVAEVDSGGEPLGLDFGAGADCRSGQDRMRPLQPGRSLEAAAIQPDRVGSLDTREVMREGEAQPDAACELGTVGARSEQPDRRDRHVLGHHPYRPERMSVGETVGLPEHQLVEALEEIIVGANFLPPAQRQRSHRVGAGRAADTEIDPARDRAPPTP